MVPRLEALTDLDARDAFPPPARHRRWRVLILVLIGFVVLAAGAYGVHSWRYWSRHVSTDDAFVEGHVSPVSARVRGTVLEVLVRDNQEVPAGAPLARLDPRDLEVKVHQARAALARWRAGTTWPPRVCHDGRVHPQPGDAREATVAGAALGIDGARRTLEERRSRLVARRASVQAAQADVAARQADFERARLDHRRMRELLDRGLIARQEFDHAEAAFRPARPPSRRRGSACTWRTPRSPGRSRGGRAGGGADPGAAAARGGRGRARRGSQPAARGDDPGRGGGERRGAGGGGARRPARGGAEPGVRARTTAPVAGRVTRRTVEVGQTVQPGQPLLAIVGRGQRVGDRQLQGDPAHPRARGPARVGVGGHAPRPGVPARVDLDPERHRSRFSLLRPRTPPATSSRSSSGSR